jgi:hypothetical protein
VRRIDLRANYDGRARRPQRARCNGGVGELPVAPGMGDPVFAPQPPDDLDGLVEPAHTLRHRHTEYLVLLGPIAESDAKQELAASDDVQKGTGFR